MIFSEQQLEALMDVRPICDRPPWSLSLTDDREVVQFYRAIIETLNARLNLKCEVEHGYGSGYASYIDAWFYPAQGGSPVRRYGDSECREGLVILFSTLSDYYAIGQGEKCKNRSGSGGSGYLPDLAMIDKVTASHLLYLVPKIEKVLEQEFFLKRIGATPLSEPIPSHLRHHEATNLGDPPYRVFDALFYWYD